MAVSLKRNMQIDELQGWDTLYVYRGRHPTNSPRQHDHLCISRSTAVLVPHVYPCPWQRDIHSGFGRPIKA